MVYLHYFHRTPVYLYSLRMIKISKRQQYKRANIVKSAQYPGAPVKRRTIVINSLQMRFEAKGTVTDTTGISVLPEVADAYR